MGDDLACYSRTIGHRLSEARMAVLLLVALGVTATGCSFLEGYARWEQQRQLNYQAWCRENAVLCYMREQDRRQPSGAAAEAAAADQALRDYSQGVPERRRMQNLERRVRDLEVYGP